MLSLSLAVSAPPFDVDLWRIHTYTRTQIVGLRTAFALSALGQDCSFGTLRPLNGRAAYLLTGLPVADPARMSDFAASVSRPCSVEPRDEDSIFTGDGFKVQQRFRLSRKGNSNLGRARALHIVTGAVGGVHSHGRFLRKDSVATLLWATSTVASSNSRTGIGILHITQSANVNGIILSSGSVNESQRHSTSSILGQSTIKNKPGNLPPDAQFMRPRPPNGE